MKFYFDEDSAQHRLIAALRSHEIDVTTFLDSGMSARDDESQLILVNAQSRILVSANRAISFFHSVVPTSVRQR